MPRWSRYDVEVLTSRMQCQVYLNIAETRIKLDGSQVNYSLQKMSVMKNLSSQFAAQFAAASLSSLVESFNGQVGLRAWSSARAAHAQALMAELVARGIDVSAVDDGHSTSFAHKVRLDESSMKLVIAE